MPGHLALQRGSDTVRTFLFVLFTVVVCLVGNLAFAQNEPETLPLKIVSQHDSRMFAPGEEIPLEIEVTPAEIGAGLSFDMNVVLTHVETSTVAWNGPASRIEAPSEGSVRAKLTVLLPVEEGVYQVKLLATRTSGFASRFIGGGNKTLAERTFQVMVFDPQREVTAPGSWREQYAFNPASARWRDRVQDWADWRRLPWIDAAEMSSLPNGARRSATGQTMVLPPATEQGAHWQVYTLPNERPGQARVIEIEWPADAPQQLAFALFDRAEGQQLQPLCEPVVVEAPRWGAKEEVRSTQLIVWPQTREPLLLIANPDQTNEARFGKIRMLSSEGQAKVPENERLVALDWGRTNPSKSVGLTGKDLFDHYLAARRIADRVQLAGANAAVVDIAHEELLAKVYGGEETSGSSIHWAYGSTARRVRATRATLDPCSPIQSTFAWN